MKQRQTIDMDEDLKCEILSISNEKAWSFSYTAYILLKQAVKERNRKKKSGKKDFGS